MDQLSGFGRILMFAGGALFALGVTVTLASKLPFFGRLPGDILLQRGELTVYLPITTMVIVSLVLTLILNLAARLFK